jgi:hypothetical protein
MTPQFSTDYDVGHIGFTYVRGFVSTSVAYFEHWHRHNPISVTHALVVSGANECIEAHLDEGVARAPLSKYFNDPNCRIVFRKPRACTPELGGRIAESAAAKIGARYNTSLIIAQAAADTFVGYWMNRLLRAAPDRLMSRLLNDPNHWICSQLVAYALAQQPEYRDRGVLRSPLDTIDPQQLFEDAILFEPDATPTPPATQSVIAPAAQ